ncbi:MAG: flagellin lysine-N-methylase [Lachnospiraceae bacterium]|nr:flagellin lysine-N-methylase [Lachnospiraceae bacterium]
MLVKKISYYDKFKCLMGECPLSCCKGWRIPLDDKAIRRFRNEKGLWGLRLRAAMHGKVQPSFSPYCFRCPFLRLDGRCGMQLKKGEEYLADICRTYPRIKFCPGSYTELQLDLSCVHVAELFLKYRDEQFFVEEESPEEYEQTGDNDDPEYLAALEKSRESLLTVIADAAKEGDAATLEEALRNAAAYAYTVQDKMMREGVSEAEALQNGFELSEDTEWLPRLFPLPIAVLNQFMSTDFYQEGMQYVLPLLYKLCRMYYKRFDKLSYEDGEKEWQRLFAKYIEGREESVRMYAAYYQSHLLRTYMECYEDYSFFKHVMDGVIGMNMIMLFEVLWREKNKGIDEGELAKIISVCERRVYHNEVVEKELMKMFMKEKRNDTTRNP